MKKSELRSMIAESIGRYLMTESFASNLLKNYIMQHGGISKETAVDCTGVLEKVTDENLLDRLIHPEEYDGDRVHVVCNDGEEFSIPISYSECNSDKAYDRQANHADDEENGTGYRTARMGKKEYGINRHNAENNNYYYHDAMDMYKKGYSDMAQDSVQGYKKTLK